MLNGTGAPSPAWPPAPGPHRRAVSLGLVNIVDYGLQFLLPVVLVRCLDPVTFGQYRLLWLMLGTVMGLVTAVAPMTLYYFLPRSPPEVKRLYVNQTVLAHALAGVLAALVVSGLDPWLPARLLPQGAGQVVVPAFVLLWVVAAVLDVLPTVEERIGWQARATLLLSGVRAVSLSLVAYLWREIEPLLFAMLVVALLRVATLIAYVARYHGLHGPLLRRSAMAEQLRFASPFWASGVLYALRGQADQWVAATLFPLASYAAFSVAGVIAPLLTPLRYSVNCAFMPSMSRCEASGDVRAMLDLNARANVFAGAVILPLFAFVFAFAEDIVTVVYTGTYVAAAPVMRVCVVGLTALVIELNSVMLLLREGSFVARLGVLTLVASAGVNWYAAHWFGLPGAAVGTALVMYVDRILTLRQASRSTGVALRALQDWPTLALLLVAAVVAAAAAAAFVGQVLPGDHAVVRALVGALVLAATYATFVAAFGRHRLRLALGGRLAA